MKNRKEKQINSLFSAFASALGLSEAKYVQTTAEYERTFILAQREDSRARYLASKRKLVNPKGF